ncbi:Uncharacterized protein PBTT_04421 [Plasmodiophora brassicae]
MARSVACAAVIALACLLAMAFVAIILLVLTDIRHQNPVEGPAPPYTRRYNNTEPAYNATRDGPDSANTGSPRTTLPPAPAAMVTDARDVPSPAPAQGPSYEPAVMEPADAGDEDVEVEIVVATITDLMASPAQLSPAGSTQRSLSDGDVVYDEVDRAVWHLFTRLQQLSDPVVDLDSNGNAPGTSLQDCMRRCSRMVPCRAFSLSPSSTCMLFSYRRCWVAPSPFDPMAGEGVTAPLYERREALEVPDDVIYESYVNFAVVDSLSATSAVEQRSRRIPSAVVSRLTSPLTLANYATGVCAEICLSKALDDGRPCRTFEAGIALVPGDGDMDETVTCRLTSDSLYDAVAPAALVATQAPAPIAPGAVRLQVVGTMLVDGQSDRLCR